MAERSGARLTSAVERFAHRRIPVFVNDPVVETDDRPRGYNFFHATVAVAGWGLHETVYGAHPLRAGEAFVITRPDVWHAYRQPRRLQVINCCFAYDLLERELSWLGDEPAVRTLLLGPAAGIVRLRLEPARRRICRNHLLVIRDRLAADADAARAVVLAHLALFLIALAGATQTTAAPGLPTRRGPHPAIVKVKRLLDENIRYPWTLPELAQQVQLDPAYLLRLFRRHTGHPPLRYLMMVRLDRAAAMLLRGNDPVGDIAAAVGIAEPAYFARRFRARFRESASDYRARRR